MDAIQGLEFKKKAVKDKLGIDLSGRRPW